MTTNNLPSTRRQQKKNYSNYENFHPSPIYERKDKEKEKENFKEGGEREYKFTCY